MAIRQFSIRTEPHVAQIGDVELKLVPEMVGSSFLDGYEKLREAQKDGSGDGTDPASIRRVTTALREFLSSMMLPESAETFAGMELPDRILIQLVEWSAELYGGGSGSAAGNGKGNGSGGGRPTMPSSGSASSRRSPGTPSKASSPSPA